MSRRRRWSGWTVALSLAACGRDLGPPPSAIELPLASLAASARWVSETDAIDIGEAAARSVLWSGWGPDERSGDTSFAWGAGEASRIVLDVVEPRSRELMLRGWSFPFGDDPPQRVTVLLNGREAGVRDLSSRPGAMSLKLRQPLWQAGENHLELRYSRFHGVPGDSPWAAGWDGLRFSDGRRDGAPSPRFDDSGPLVLPARTAIEWTLELPGNAWLAWNAVSASGTAALRVATRRDEGEVETDHGVGRLGVRLSGRDEPRQPVTIALRAVGGDGEVRVEGGRLLLSESPDDEASRAVPSPPATPPHLVIYLIDTLRADHLGAYGYPRPTSPAIDRFAGESVRWIDARAQSSWTRPAVATILSGLPPITHGVERIGDALPKEVETLGERLRAAGYETALFTTNANIVERFGFRQGWDHFAYLRRRSGGRSRPLDSAEMNVAVFRWLDRRQAERPLALVVHTLDPHDSYLPAERFRRALAPDVPRELGCCEAMRQLQSLSGAAAVARSEQLRLLYDAEIAQNDASFGDLLAELERRGLGDSAAVLLISDHGEEFYEHGRWKHGWSLYEEMLRVPFILRLPGRAHAHTVLPGPVDQIDVVPTLIELAGLPVANDLPGVSVLGELRGEPRPPRPSLAWLKRGPEQLASAMLQQWKLIRRQGAWIAPTGEPPFRLYALGSDPLESNDLALTRATRRLWLETQLRLAMARSPAAHPVESVTLDGELEATLRALGYL